MKKQLAIGLAATLGFAGAAVVAGGEQDGQETQMYCIYKEVVKPGMTKQYEDAVKYMVSEFKAYQIDPEKVNFKTVSGPELGYIYVMPMDNFASMDQMKVNWGEAVKILGADKFEALVAPAEEAMESLEIFHVERLNELSYTPENPRLKPEEIEYVHYGFYYVIPGKGHDFEAIAKEFHDLYESNGVDNGWSIYRSMTGTDLPLYVVAQAAKSAADFYSNREKTREMLGDAGKKIGEKVGAAVRKIEYKEGMPRPDLSYPQPAETESTD